MAQSFFKFFRHAPWRIKLKVLVLYSLAVVIAGGSLWIIGKIILLPNYAPSLVRIPLFREKPARVPSALVPEYTYPFELKPLSIQMTDRNKMRTAYAQFTLVFDCPSPESVAQMELQRARLLDTINEIAGQFHTEDFLSPDGFSAFKGTILRHYRGFLNEDAPRQVALKDWVMN